MKRKHFAVLIFIVVLTRIPLLVTGFGADGDAWRVAKVSSQLWETGKYQVSRFPGFPVYEISNAPIVGLGGSVASNAATLVLFIIALIIFHAILVKQHIQFPAFITTVFAFFPILWKNSALTMDYIWGMTGILITILLLLHRKYFFAGIVLALAAGTRITHSLYVLPFFFLFEKNDWKNYFLFFMTAFIVSVALYIPVILSSGYYTVVLDYLADVRNYSLSKKIGFYLYRFTYSIGLLGTFSLCILFLIRRKRIIEKFEDPFFQTSVASIITALCIFSILPDEREYLIPMMPFLLIVVALIADKKLLIAVVLCLLSYSFISVDVLKHDIRDPKFCISFQQGYVMKELNDRRRNYEWRTAVSNATVPDSSIVMIGAGPIFWMENPAVVFDKDIEALYRQDCSHSVRQQNVYYMYSLYKPQLDDFKRRGYRIYYTSDAKDYLETFVGYDLNKEGVMNLPVP